MKTRCDITILLAFLAIVAFMGTKKQEIKEEKVSAQKTIEIQSGDTHITIEAK